MKKFLVIQTAFIGDVVLATAVVEKLHRFYPDAKIDFLLRKGNEGLLYNHPFIAKVYIWDKKNNKLFNLLKIAAEVRKERYDYVINLHRFTTSGIITALSGAKETIGFDKNPLSFLFGKEIKHVISKPYTANPIHETERNQQLIADITDAEAARPHLYPTDADKEQVKQYQTTPYVCIAPSSVWFTKQYPKEKWLELIDALPEEYNIYLLGGPGDTQLANEIKTAAKNSNAVVNLCGELNFLASAALMAGATMNYVNDSAPMHFASAMNAPVTAVYCSTVPAFGFGPLSDNSKVADVGELYCRPCGLHGRKECPEGHFRCAKDINTQQLLW